MLATRTADPYADVEVIDARAPRFNQATVGVVSLLAVLSGWRWLLALLAIQLLVGLVLGAGWAPGRLADGPHERASQPLGR